MTLKSVRPQSLEISWRNNNVIGRNLKNGQTVWKGGYSVLLKSELLVIENVAPMSLLHPHFILEILSILTFQRFQRFSTLLFFMTKNPKKKDEILWILGKMLESITVIQKERNRERYTETEF